MLVLDSLGWEQLEARRHLAPTLSSLPGGPVTTVAPSTTAAALTSISTGVPPGEHGIVGYRFRVDGAVLNALRWTVSGTDHRDTFDPALAQLATPFGGTDWEVVGDRQYRGSAFTEAYLGDAAYHPVWHPSSMIVEVRRRIDAGAKRIYAYYDGIDHVAHVYGMETGHVDAEYGFADWFVHQLIDSLPAGTALVVTGDHGQIDAPTIQPVSGEVLGFADGRSGEARFRWLHAKRGAAEDLHAAAQDQHGHHAWIWSLDEIIDSNLFGPVVSDEARRRLGDVALVPFEPFGFDDPNEPHLDRLVGRHGSMTSAEMLVPVLYAVV